MSDGDDDRDNLDENDPHRALGDIIFDDYKLQPEQDQVMENLSFLKNSLGGVLVQIRESQLFK